MKKKMFFLSIFVFFILISTFSVTGININNFKGKKELSLVEKEKIWFENNPDSLPIWLTNEEQKHIDEIGKGFIKTSPPPGPVRQAAEFEPMEGALIRYPFGISYQLIAEISEDVILYTIVNSISERDYVLSQYQNYGVNTDNCEFLIAPSNSYWTRDYGPWFIFNGDDEQGVVNFIYNRNRPLDNQIPVEYSDWQDISLYNMDLIHTGGNYMTDGQGIAVSTDLVIYDNPTKTQEQIKQIVEDYLGINEYHIVPDALGEYIEHIDCWAKFLSPEKIMIIEVSPSHLRYDEIEDAVEYFENQSTCYGTSYEIDRIYTNGQYPYINSLILNDKILVPLSGSQWDDDAMSSYENSMPGYEIIGFYGSWMNTDALHCRVKGVVDREMLYIKHTPVYETQDNHYGYEINAEIFAYSNEEIIADSTGVFWKADGGSWNFVEMQYNGADQFYATIPPQETGTQIYYYIQAEDESGRIETHPYIGAPMAYSFDTIFENEGPETPVINGPNSGIKNVEYTYILDSTEDPESDEIYAFWDWGDGTQTEWLGPYSSGEQITKSHSWNSDGTYLIKAKIKDQFGFESDWTELSVSIPKNRGLFYNIINRIINKFPILRTIFF